MIPDAVMAEIMRNLGYNTVFFRGSNYICRFDSIDKSESRSRGQPAGYFVVISVVSWLFCLYFEGDI